MTSHRRGVRAPSAASTSSTLLTLCASVNSVELRGPLREAPACAMLSRARARVARRARLKKATAPCLNSVPICWAPASQARRGRTRPPSAKSSTPRVMRVTREFHVLTSMCLRQESGPSRRCYQTVWLRAEQARPRHTRPVLSIQEGDPNVPQSSGPGSKLSALFLTMLLSTVCLAPEHGSASSPVPKPSGRSVTADSFARMLHASYADPKRTPGRACSTRGRGRGKEREPQVQLRREAKVADQSSSSRARRREVEDASGEGG